MKTNGSERLRVTQNGDVGIGTTAPGAKLEIGLLLKRPGWPAHGRL